MFSPPSSVAQEVSMVSPPLLRRSEDDFFVLLLRVDLGFDMRRADAA
jgi:hypothetical protein